MVIRASLQRSAIAGIAVLLSSLGGYGAAPAPAAEPGADCAAAFEPYSSRSVLLDLLLNPAARSVVARSGALQGAPPELLQTATPAFAAIITPRHLAMFTGAKVEFTELDRALASIPVTGEDARIRCARYDRTPPDLAAPTRRPAILVFDKSTGFKDEPSVRAAHAALREIAARRGWALVATGNGAAFNPRQLAAFDAVVWNNVSGDVLTLPQRAALKNYVESGGGFAAMHGSGGDFVYLWDWYADELIGARFAGHPRDPQFQQARVVVADPAHPAAQGLPREWRMTEEWYAFSNNPRARGARIIAVLDESTYALGALRMGDHPIAWTRCVGRGRSFYTAIGHLPASYVEPNSRQLLEQGIAWAADRAPCG